MGQVREVSTQSKGCSEPMMGVLTAAPAGTKAQPLHLFQGTTATRLHHIPSCPPQPASPSPTPSRHLVPCRIPGSSTPHPTQPAADLP